MWTSLGKSIGDFVEERFTSPLISSFALAWAVVNYKFFVILLSKESVARSFVLIGELFPNWEVRILNGFVIPLGIALFYLFVFPYPSQWVYKHWRRNLQKTDTIKQDYENAKRLTLDESRELRKNINELELAADQAATVIRGLRTDLQAAHNKAAELEVQMTKLPSLEAAVEMAKTEKLAAEKEVKVQLDQNSKLRVEATMARERLAQAEAKISETEERARIAHVQAFSRAVFDFGANDRLTENQSKRLKELFDAAERGDREISSMYKTIFNVLTQTLRKAAVSKTIVSSTPNDEGDANKTGRANPPEKSQTQAEKRATIRAAQSAPVRVQTLIVPMEKPTNKLAELMKQVPPGTK